MLRRFAFWSLAVVVAAAVAYAVTVPSARSPERLETEAEATAETEPEAAAVAREEPEPELEPRVRAAGPDAPPVPEPLAIPEPEPEPEPAAIDVGILATETLPFDASCGLQIRPAGQTPVIFASGISLDPGAGGPAAIQIDGDLTELRRAGIDGEPIGHGQHQRQLFQSADGTVSVVLEIELEGNLLGDWAQVTDGSLTVTKNGRPPLQLPVGGRVGC